MCRIPAGRSKSHHRSSTCPFTIRPINHTTHLVRERDNYGEFPHINVKRYSQIDTNGETVSVLVINDSGVGTDVTYESAEAPAWNIKSFIDSKLNPGAETPYLVMLSHCHYDHILGLRSLLGSDVRSNAHSTGTHPQVQIVSSAQGRSFTTPYENLQEHSICNSMGLLAPDYQTAIWAEDNAPLVYNHPSGTAITLPIITLCTPGHTPDSLSWFDTEERILYVGDSFYEQQSRDTRNASWGPEALMPILFTKESNLYDWWQSLERLIQFVAREDQGADQLVKLAASHVTADVNAAEFLLHVRGFMMKLLRDGLAFEKRPAQRGGAFGHWTDPSDGRFSVGAPLHVAEEGRRRLLCDKGKLSSVPVIGSGSNLEIGFDSGP